MIEKVESFVKILKWKAFYFCKEKENPENKPQNLFGFKSPATPTQNKHLNSFENALYDLIQSIEFKTVRNEFLNKLQKDVENIRSSKNMLVFANKSTNIYEVSREHYEKLLQDNITQTYKRASPGAKRRIDKESKQFAKHLGIDDRMECYSDQHAFITLKHHKDNFKNNPKCRLINANWWY